MIYDSLATQVKVFQHEKNYPALFADRETMWIFYSSIYNMDQNLVFSVFKLIYFCLFVRYWWLASMLYFKLNLIFHCNHTMIGQWVVNEAEGVKDTEH